VIKVSNIPAMLAELGVSMNVPTQVSPDDLPICVQLDGNIIGWCESRQAKKIANELRIRKFDEVNSVCF
jgi:hypothetical protein